MSAMPMLSWDDIGIVHRSNILVIRTARLTPFFFPRRKPFAVRTQAFSSIKVKCGAARH
jgi:hypothetical protein